MSVSGRFKMSVCGATHESGGSSVLIWILIGSVSVSILVMLWYGADGILVWWVTTHLLTVGKIVSSVFMLVGVLLGWRTVLSLIICPIVLLISVLRLVTA
jgi:hypothetical protein